MHRFGIGIPSIVILFYLKERKVNFIFLLEQSKSRKNGIPVHKVQRVRSSSINQKWGFSTLVEPVCVIVTDPPLTQF